MPLELDTENQLSMILCDSHFLPNLALAFARFEVVSPAKSGSSWISEIGIWYIPIINESNSACFYQINVRVYYFVCSER